MREQDLAEVQRRRIWPTRLIQAGGLFAQRNLTGRLMGRRPLAIPHWFRGLSQAPLLRDRFPRFGAIGLWRVRVEGG